MSIQAAVEHSRDKSSNMLAFSTRDNGHGNPRTQDVRRIFQGVHQVFINPLNDQSSQEQSCQNMYMSSVPATLVVKKCL